MNKQTSLDHGKLKKSAGPADYHFHSAHDFFSIPSNLIPDIGGVSGGRVLLGAKSTLQALSLVDREVPLIQSVSKQTDDPFVKTFGHELLTVKATEPGTVTEVTPDEIHTKNGSKTKSYEIYNYFNLGRKSFLHHDAHVKVGDHVKAGDILATSNYTDKHGMLALGKNLRTAVMPYRSGNFEDALVVTESGARKLDAEQIIRCRAESRLGVEVDKNKYISLFPNKYLNSQLAHIDNDGAAKVGTVLHYGDPIILALSPKTLKSLDVQLGKLSKLMKNAYRDNSQTWSYEHPGEVVDVNKTGDLVSVNIKTRRGLAVGDKLSSAFGAKGVVGSIIPDAQSPQDADGKPVDLILNSMSVTSRVAPALLVTMGLGKVAQKLGHPIKMRQFSEGSVVQHTIDEMKKHGVSDVETLYDPVTGTHSEVLVGPLFTSRLTHIAEDKESSRSQGVGYNWDLQPGRAEGEVSKKVGSLATSALLSHGATAVLRDFGTIKSVKNDEYWRRLKLGQPLPSPEVPFIFNKFIASLEGAGINVRKQGNVFQILPQTDKDILAKSSGPIEKALTFKTKKDTLIPEEGGLFDPAKVGVFSDHYNHIELNHAVPNPISEDYLRKLLKVTKLQYEKLIIDGSIGKMLNDIHLDDKITEYKKYLKTGKKTDRDNTVKVLSFLQTLKKEGMHPRDLLLTKVPVIPAQFRPIIAQGDKILPSPVNNLYKDLMLNNNELKDLKDVPQDIQDTLKREQYAAVKAIFGLGDPISPKNREKEIKGLLSTTLGTKGGSAKTTMFQAKVVNKSLDLVGRAVLTPDATLDLDNASVPQDVLWKTYSPFIIRRLVQKGVPATKAMEYVKNHNPMAVEALTEELAHRPAIISRDPVLHKFNLTGFYLKPNADPKDKTIKLNPLVFKSFGADNDGDQLNVNVPASEEARLEVRDKMLPSRNLLSPKGFQPMYTPSNESALGLFQLSTSHSTEKPLIYKSESEVVEDWKKGKLNIADNVQIG